MQATTKSVLFFLIVYLGSMSIFGTGIGYLYYIDQKNALIEKMRSGMRNKAISINSRLEYYHETKSENFTFYDEGYDIALYDRDKHLIASTFNDPIDFSQLFYAYGLKYYLVESIFKEYLGVKYIVIKQNLSTEKLNNILKQISIIALFGFSFLLFVSLLLSKIMLYPIKDLIHTLKTFMKNTTHEMNTPISTILMSYEHMDKTNLTEKQLRALSRIDIAAKTLSGLYNDLSFVSFHNYIKYEDKPVNVEEVVLERIRYMDTLIQFKEIDIQYDLRHKTISMDKRKLILVIDNLLSNAIKFSKKNGKIKIVLRENYYTIKDNGIGISKENQKKIFERFESFHIQDGFGVGLDIVNQICREYNIGILLDSEVSKGSEFKLMWPTQKNLRPA
ncbi:MAG: two-component system, OmpR family, sensor kinase [Campylobacterota bacterium]|nr:two-component system, OmpR family, sensor kinase [Campylobacterota bacterium]